MNPKIFVLKSRSRCAPRFSNEASQLRRRVGIVALNALLGGALLGGCGNSSASPAPKVLTFRPAATFDVNTTGGKVAEIAAVTGDGKTLLYTDSATGRIGFVDISDLAKIHQLGFFPGQGSPTSVIITPDDRYAIAVFEQTNKMVVLDVAKRKPVRIIDLPGQPDCVKISRDGRFAAIVIENERPDQTVPMPVAPSGSLAIVSLGSHVAQWKLRNVALPLPKTLDYPTDAEPEYISINARNQAAVTLQENNGVVVVDLKSAKALRYFSCGRTTHPADLKKDGKISFTDTLKNARRQPDGIAWTPSGNLITANEGDYDLDVKPGEFVGGRNFTVFSPTGKIIFDEKGDMEKAVAAAGLYNDKRSEKKGIEVENVAIDNYKGHNLAFFALERANALAVYRLNSDAKPVLQQILPTGQAPEGIVTVPSRNLVITANEKDGTISFFTL